MPRFWSRSSACWLDSVSCTWLPPTCRSGCGPSSGNQLTNGSITSTTSTGTNSATSPPPVRSSWKAIRPTIPTIRTLTKTTKCPPPTTSTTSQVAIEFDNQRRVTQIRFAYDSSHRRRFDLQQLQQLHQRCSYPEHGRSLRMLQQQHTGQNLDHGHALPVPVLGRVQVRWSIDSESFWRTPRSFRLWDLRILQPSISSTLHKSACSVIHWQIDVIRGSGFNADWWHDAGFPSLRVTGLSDCYFAPLPFF